MKSNQTNPLKPCVSMTEGIFPDIDNDFDVMNAKKEPTKEEYRAEIHRLHRVMKEIDLALWKEQYMLAKYHAENEVSNFKFN